MKHHPRTPFRRRALGLATLWAGTLMAQQDPAGARPGATLEQTRLAMGKWIETQQIISKERKDWQQGKEILLARKDVVAKEVTTLGEQIERAQAKAREGEAKCNDLRGERAELESALAKLGTAVAGMETALRGLAKTIPEPIRAKLQPLYERMPQDPTNTKITVAERFQNVLGILNELNKASQEITVGYEVHELQNGKPAEVKTIYVGLAQAYYVSASGEAGIGRPTPEGWQWRPAREVAGVVLTALEIVQGKQSPAFVPLPMRLK